MAGYWIWHGSEYSRVTQGSRYVTMSLDISEWDVSMSEYMIIMECDNRQVSEYVKVVNMSHKIHSASSLYKLMSIYWEMRVFRTLLR